MSYSTRTPADILATMTDPTPFLIVECAECGTTVTTSDYRTSVTMRAVAMVCADGECACADEPGLSCFNCCGGALYVGGNGERARD